MKKNSHDKRPQLLQEYSLGDQRFVMQNLDEIFNHEQYNQRIPVMNYSYSVNAGKPVIYFRNLYPIIIN